LIGLGSLAQYIARVLFISKEVEFLNVKLAKAGNRQATETLLVLDFFKPELFFAENG
jgi:hypothetical protein